MANVIFNGDSYKLVFTEHALERMKERCIDEKSIKNSIEAFDINYQKYGKEIVEKKINKGIIRTVFTLKVNHIILITSMILGK